MPTNKTMDLLKLATDILLQANAAAPIISSVIMVIASIFKGLTGTGPTLTAIADMLEQKIGRTDATIKAEIARLKALLPPPVEPN